MLFISSRIYPFLSRVFGNNIGTLLSVARTVEALSVQGITTANVYVCTYVGGGSVVGGRASSASTNSWESQQSTPVSLGRVQRIQNIIQPLHYFIGFHYSVDLPMIITSALLRVLSIIFKLEAERNVPRLAIYTSFLRIYLFLIFQLKFKSNMYRIA